MRLSVLEGLSKAVFRSRAQEVGLEAAAIQTAIDLNIGTLGQFGFSTSYIPGPGQQDETPLKDLVKILHNHPNIEAVTIGQMTAVRRLYLEASFKQRKNKNFLLKTRKSGNSPSSWWKMPFLLFLSLSSSIPQPCLQTSLEFRPIRWA